MVYYGGYDGEGVSILYSLVCRCIDVDVEM